MSSTALEKWMRSSMPSTPYARFRIAFAAIWLLYDVLDVSLGGTRGAFWSVSDPGVHRAILGSQLALIACETALLLGWRPRLMALLALAARGFEARYFMLNDFLYYCVAALILASCSSQGGWSRAAERPDAPSWPRDVFVLETAWIYFSTAFLKLNGAFLAGSELYVRQNYLADIGWPYPAFYRSWIATLGGNVPLSWMAVAAEFSLAGLLVAWWALPRKRKPLRAALLLLVVGVHGFAAAALNVYFFGASMIAQVTALTWEP